MDKEIMMDKLKCDANKRCTSPILSAKKMNKVRENYVISSKLKSPDLSQAMKNKKKAIEVLNLNEQKEEEYNFCIKNVFDSQNNTTRELLYNKKSHIINEYKGSFCQNIDGNLLKNHTIKNKCLKKPNNDDSIIEKHIYSHENYSNKSILKAFSPDLSMSKNSTLMKNSKSKRLARRNLFGKLKDKQSLIVNNTPSSICLKENFDRYNEKISIENTSAESNLETLDINSIISDDELKCNTSSKRYGTLSVITKKIHSYKQNKMYGCENCGLKKYNVSSSIHTNSLNIDKFSDVSVIDESLNISEVSSVFERNSSIKKPLVKVKTLDCNKVCVFDRDNFENVFEVSNAKKTKKISNLFIDKLEAKPTSNKLNEINDTVNGSFCNELEISEISSNESSPELKSLCNSCPSKKSFVLQKKFLKNKTSTTLLKLDITSPRISCLNDCNILKNKIIDSDNLKNKSCTSLYSSNKKSNNETKGITNSSSLKKGRCVHNEGTDDKSFKIEQKNEQKCDDHNSGIDGKHNSPNKFKDEEMIIECSGSLPPLDSSNRSAIEIEFSDTSTLGSGPKTPPSKMSTFIRKEIHIDSSTKKRKKKHPDDSLSSRLCTIRNRYESNSALVQHMLTKKDKPSDINYPIFFVKNIMESYSKIILYCQPTNTPDTPKLKCESKDDFVLKNLLVLADLKVFTSINIKPGIYLKIHPPWKVFNSHDRNFTIVIGPSCLEVIPKTASASFNKFSEDKIYCSTIHKIKCSCFEDSIKKDYCDFKIPDDLFFEIFCPPPPDFQKSVGVVKKNIPQFYYNIDYLKGTIGNARCYSLFKTDYEIVISVLHSVDELPNTLLSGKKFIFVKDEIEEISVIVLKTEKDVDKWNTQICSNVNGCKRLFKISGFQFSHRILYTRCKVIEEINKSSLLHQLYIYSLSPKSPDWNIIENY